MSRIKYPNPGFFRAKDQMDWKAQGENLKEVMEISMGLIKETDWKAFAAGQKKNALDFAKRVAEEFQELAALPPEERKEVFLHGERKLGRLYKKGGPPGMARRRRYGV